MISLHEAVVSLVGILDNAGPREIRHAKAELRNILHDLNYPATQRRIAAVLLAALGEIR